MKKYKTGESSKTETGQNIFFGSSRILVDFLTSILRLLTFFLKICFKYCVYETKEFFRNYLDNS